MGAVTSKVAGEVEVYGQRMFELLEGGLDDATDVAWIRLSRAGWTPCQAGEEAALMSGFLEVWREVDELADDALASGVGLVANHDGEIVGFVDGSGKVFSVRFVGESEEIGASESAVRMSLVSLGRDEAFDGKPFRAGNADFWAMGRPT